MTDQGSVASGPPWPVLDARERRALGVLVEKQKTTPDAYPLSLNALVTGCNQKSNREPVMDLNDLDLEDTLSALQKKRLVMRVTGGRVERWRHLLYDECRVDRVEMAVLCELLLRGPQTEGELRSRASRMDAIEDLDTLRSMLKSLAERKLVVYLSPEGRRGTMLTHGFHTPTELEKLRGRHAAGGDEDDAPRAETRPVSPPVVPVAAPAPAPPPPPPPPVVPPELLQDVAALKQEVEQLRQRVATLEGQLSELRRGLGVG